MIQTCLPIMANPSRFSFVLIASLVLAACGGGDGNTSKVPSRNPTPPTDREREGRPSNSPTPDLIIPTIPSSAGRLARIAKARPKPGSVTQSNRIGEDGVTLDRITFTPQAITNHRTNEVISRRHSLPYSQGEKNFYTMDLVQPSAPFPLLSRFFDKDVKGNTVIEGEVTNFPKTTVWALHRTSDYLTMGWWYDERFTGSFAADYEGEIDHVIENVSVFVAGGNIFNKSIPIKGTASYHGAGMINVIDNRKTHRIIDRGSYSSLNSIFLRSKALLNVDFESGVISGKLYDYNHSVGEIILRDARIGNDHGGFFEGNITGSFDNKTYQGIYGGQFYGNEEIDGKPSTVAGTLGGISSDNNFTMIGVWMGDKVDE